MTNVELLRKAYQDARKNQSKRTFAELEYWCAQYELIARNAIIELENQEKLAKFKEKTHD